MKYPRMRAVGREVRIGYTLSDRMGAVSADVSEDVVTEENVKHRA